MNLRIALESSHNGVFAHALDLPGCFSRGSNRAEALSKIKLAAAQYLAELEGCGEAAPLSPSAAVQIAEEIDQDSGPFHPGDKSALFEADRRPVTPAEIELFFRLADCTRHKLLNLAGELTDDLYDWPLPYDPDTTIRRVLRHIGNAERWYASRISRPEELPPGWKTDDQLPIDEFLVMSRRTAREMFTALSADRLAGEVVLPTHITSGPGEPWTVRKALRRMLEHEREHIGQVQEILEVRKHFLKKALNRTRDTLGELAAHLPAGEHTTRTVTGSWTLREVIGHLADWEKIGLVYAEKALRGEPTQVMPGFSEGRVDQINAGFVEIRRRQTWEEVWEDYTRTREAMIRLLEGAPVEVLKRVLTPPWDGTLSLASFFSAWAEHDQEHIEMIRAETGLMD